MSSRSDAYLVSGNEVADEQEDAHDDMLGDGHDVRARDLEHLDTPLDGRIEVDVVRADTSSDADLEVLRLNEHQIEYRISKAARTRQRNAG